MLGFSAFSRAPFSSLSNVAHSATLTEGLSISFIVGFGNTANISEGITFGDSFSASTNFPVAVVEGLTSQDYRSIVAGFAALPAESMTIGDILNDFHYPVSVGWTPIDTQIYTASSPVGIMLGGSPFSVTAISGFGGGTVIVTPGWKDIINN